MLLAMTMARKATSFLEPLSLPESKSRSTLEPQPATMADAVERVKLNPVANATCDDACKRVEFALVANASQDYDGK
jgi:hypothetical protein